MFPGVFPWPELNSLFLRTPACSCAFCLLLVGVVERTGSSKVSKFVELNAQGVLTVEAAIITAKLTNDNSDLFQRRPIDSPRTHNNLTNARQSNSHHNWSAMTICRSDRSNYRIILSNIATMIPAMES